MAEITTTSPQAEPEGSIERRGWKRFLVWHRLALGGILLISIFMDFYQLGKNGFGSYYPPAVRSMMDNWHNFFFAAYDPGGFASIDKPPVGFWLQVASAKLFGFTPFSVLLPQALAGVLSVLLLYYLVRRHFGVVAGLLAALALAVSPVNVVINRNVTIDSTLVLTLLLAAWAVLRAAETGRLRWLLLTAALTGIGFNIKMLEAYLVVPAFGLLYLLAAPRSIWTRVWHLALAGLVLLVISFSWVATVDLIPASQRPWVAATSNNSEMSLALGYNGIERLFGHSFPNAVPPGGSIPRAHPGVQQSPTGGTGTTQTLTRYGNGNNNTPDLLRLFTPTLGGQVSWLLTLALLGTLALAWQRRPRLHSDAQQRALVLWGTWLLTTGIFFSVASSLTHSYYTATMAPAIAALFGIGLVTMWQDYRRGGWRRWFLPASLLLTFAEQVFLLTSYPTWGQWMLPFLVVSCVLAVGALVAARFPQILRREAFNTRVLLAALGIGVLALLVAPTVWAALPVLQGTQADILQAGPQEGNVGVGGGVFFTGSTMTTPQSGEMISLPTTTVDPALVSYLEANQGETKFLVATDVSSDQLILDTNKPVITLSGFSAHNLTVDQITAMVAQNTVRFFLFSPPNANQSHQVILGAGPGQDTPTTTWVRQHCQAVPAALWQSVTTRSTSRSGNQLYDCTTTH